MQIRVVKYATKLKVSKQIFIKDVCVMKFLPQPSGKQQRIQQRACWAMNQKRQGSFASKRKTTKSHFNSVFVLEGHGHGGGAYVFVHQRE
jgi:hypothetical protein